MVAAESRRGEQTWPSRIIESLCDVEMGGREIRFVKKAEMMEERDVTRAERLRQRGRQSRGGGRRSRIFVNSLLIQ